MKSSKQFALLCSITLATGAQAQTTLFIEDFNAASGSPAGYTFGDFANDMRAYVDGVGVGGTRAVVNTVDFPSGPNGFGGMAFQYQNGSVAGNTSTDLSDYTLTFDAAVNVANGGFSLTVQSWQGMSFGGNLTGQIESTTDILVATPGTFEGISVNLGTLINNAGVGAGSFDPLGQTWQIAFQMNAGTWGVPSTGNELIIDNVAVTLVPEPSTVVLALLGAAGMGGLAFARRRKV